MKLLYSPTSPYARKVRMTIIARGLDDQVELVAANPFDDQSEVVKVNPLNKVPALITDDLGALFDSRVICAYLDTLGDAPKLIAEGAAGWRMRRSEATTDGLLDAAFATVMERRRDEVQQSSMWLERWRNAIMNAADSLERDPSLLDGPLNMAQIAAGSALGYLDFRLDEMNWRSNRPTIATWYEKFSSQPMMTATKPDAA